MFEATNKLPARKRRMGIFPGLVKKKPLVWSALSVWVSNKKWQIKHGTYCWGFETCNIVLPKFKKTYISNSKGIKKKHVKFSQAYIDSLLNNQDFDGDVWQCMALMKLMWHCMCCMHYSNLTLFSILWTNLKGQACTPMGRKHTCGKK